MTTRITHMKILPKNVDYWDYYILCRLNSNASKCLQRMEYWDGTKTNGNVHAEQINDQLVESGKIPNQDTSRFVYKSREELAWELMGACGERTAYECLDYLTDSLQYLKTRHNPYKTWDRTLQYEFQSDLVQEHLDKLYAIVKHFCTLLGRQEKPVLYAIEQLTSEGIYVNRVIKKDGSLDGKGVLTTDTVSERLRKMHREMRIDEEGCKQKQVKGEKRYKPILPAFVRLDLKKDESRGFSETSDLPLCKNAQCNTSILHNATPQNCTIDPAETHDASCKNAQAIPVTTTVTTNNDYFTEKDNVVGESESSTDTNAASAANTPSPSSQENHDEPTPPTVTETSTVAPVVDAPTPSEPSKQEENATQQNEQPKKPRTPRTPNVEKPAPAPLVMPTQDAKWCAETAVQIVEFCKKRHYSETTRKQELAEAKKVIDTEYEGGKIRREQFENAWNEMVSWSFWNEKNIAPMIKHLHKDDKIVSILDGLKPKNGNGKKTNGNATTPNKQSDSWDDRMQALVPDFKVLKQWEVMELPMPERKAYNAQLREHLAKQDQLSAQAR